MPASEHNPWLPAKPAQKCPHNLVGKVSIKLHPHLSTNRSQDDFVIPSILMISVTPYLAACFFTASLLCPPLITTTYEIYTM